MLQWYVAAQKALDQLIGCLSVVAFRSASNAVVLRKSRVFILLRGNRDGSVDVTPTIKLKQLPQERAERFIRALDELVADYTDPDLPVVKQQETR